ncbi:hypothetical protein A3Q56_00148 [Intoshia linei]|uniref:Tektin n=1 Tax=Intoshia linei TaxID=1819745 RepID=A0A177BCM9_9BILA|nr:hypothetical protein A3Q56_00148 [Intoshia linei]
MEYKEISENQESINTYVYNSLNISHPVSTTVHDENINSSLSVMAKYMTDEAKNFNNCLKNFSEKARNVTNLNQRNTNINIKCRLKILEKLISELMQKIRHISKVNLYLMKLWTFTRKNFNNTMLPTEINVDNIMCRSRRMDIDNTLDESSESLNMEFALLAKVRNTFKCLMEKLKDQIDKNAEIKYELEKDYSNKVESSGFDKNAANIMNHKSNKNLYRKCKIAENLQSIEAWKNVSFKNIDKGNEAIKASRILKFTVKEMIKRMNCEMQEISRKFENKLSENINKNKNVKFILQTSLANILNTIKNNESIIKDIDALCGEQAEPEKVADARIWNISKKYESEKYIDDLENGLNEEVNNILKLSNASQNKLNMAEKLNKNLFDNRNYLEKGIMAKTDALYIDQIKCMSKRCLYPKLVD